MPLLIKYKYVFQAQDKNIAFLGSNFFLMHSLSYQICTHSDVHSNIYANCYTLPFRVVEKNSYCWKNKKQHNLFYLCSGQREKHKQIELLVNQKHSIIFPDWHLIILQCDKHNWFSCWQMTHISKYYILNLQTKPPAFNRMCFALLAII